MEKVIVKYISNKSSLAMRVLFFGHRGWIGGQVVDEWKRRYPQDEVVLATVRVDHDTIERVESLVQNVDLVVSTVGRTSGTKPDGTFVATIDYVEHNIYENVKNNAFVGLLLALLCLQHSKRLLYLGTGCIFSTDTTVLRKGVCHSYTEADTPDFFGSGYSVVKGYVDTLMKCGGLSSVVLNARIRMPLSDKGDEQSRQKNFITKIAGYSKICSYPNSMTYLPDMIPILIEMFRAGVTGTVNATQPGWMDHQQILEVYKHTVNPQHSYELIDETELNGLLAAKRSNNILTTSVLEDFVRHNGEKLNLKLRGLQECVQEACERLSNERSE